jgi:hypothetical protein
MRVVFGFDSSHDRVVKVLWEDDRGQVKVRIRKPDGSTKYRDMGHAGLAEVVLSVGGAYSPMYPTDVDDLRSAFQYLGKAADLVETLPKAYLGDKQTNSQAS